MHTRVKTFVTSKFVCGVLAYRRLAGLFIQEGGGGGGGGKEGKAGRGKGGRERKNRFLANLPVNYLKTFVSNQNYRKHHRMLLSNYGDENCGLRQLTPRRSTSYSVQ